ncbi:MAG: hypothetical protein OEZ38_09720 [Gammaproteobacteria bacterium]|nr:hypothetical protein [Gammaproteobacteria bacterium]
MVTSLTACSSIPYNRLKTPGISGTISINNEAAQGLEVYLSTRGDDKLCYRTGATTRTGPEGEFNFLALKEQMTHEPIARHFLDEWNICTEYKSQRIPLHSGNRYGIGSVNELLTLRCELNQKQLGKYCSTD